jgi:hypothetical protein
MSNFDKISILLGIQFLLFVSLAGSFWFSEGLTVFKRTIPKDSLEQHRHQLRWILLVPCIAFFIFNVWKDWSKAPWVHIAADLSFLMICICFFARAILTLKSSQFSPARLKQLAIFEMACALAGIALISTTCFSYFF